MLTVARLLGSSDFEGGPLLARFWRREMRLAVEALLAILVAGLNLDQADVEPRVMIGRKAQRAGDVNSANRLAGFDVVQDSMTGFGSTREPGCRAPGRAPK